MKNQNQNLYIVLQDLESSNQSRNVLVTLQFMSGKWLEGRHLISQDQNQRAWTLKNA